jgi:hypothetical protein
MNHGDPLLLEQEGGKVLITVDGIALRRLLADTALT